jgi:hypothetical protein
MTKNKRRVLKHTILAAAISLVMGLGIVSFADDKGTVTVSSAKIRASADASSEQLGSVTLGDTIDIISQTTGTDGSTWYQVYVEGSTKGYIRADLVQKSGTGTISTTTSTTTTATDTSVTEATAVDAKKCTVSQNSVRIRKGASTNHEVVATANRGMTLTITGEATGSDGKLWYQVTFTYNSKDVTGFIRSDLVTFDEVSNEAAVSEITGEAGTEGEGEVQTDTEVQDTEGEESSDTSSQGIVLMNVDETPYILPGFNTVSLSWNDESITAYSNGGFYIFYARMENGDEGWYVFDSEKGVYQRYVYTASATATVPSDSEGVGIVPVIILVVIIIIMALIIGILFIKLKDNSYVDEFDDSEDDSDDGELEIEEIEPRRPQPRPQPQQPQRQQRQPVQGANGNVQVRRPQPQQSTATANGQVRRPQNISTVQGQTVSGQVRRPQPQTASNVQPIRRPQSTGTTVQGQTVNGQQVRRPRPQSAQTVNGTANGNIQPVRRPQPQQRPVANETVQQQGHKAKPIIEKQEDDMEFIDI